MNEKQRRFAEYYASNPNATEAAKAAGYSERTAYSQGQRLLKNVEVQTYLKELQDMLASERIASVDEVKAVWTELLRSPNERARDRIKAGELLVKTSGAFLSQNPEGADEDDVIIVVPDNGRMRQKETDETDSEECVIVVPYDGRGGTPPNAVQMAGGEIVPFADLSDHNRK